MGEAAAAMAYPAAEQSAIWQRGGYIFLCAMEGDADCWIIENVASLPSYRRRGLATALLARALEAGRSCGRKEAQITFLVGNDRAERAYMKAGFGFAGERRHSKFEAVSGAPGLRRVARAL